MITIGISIGRKLGLKILEFCENRRLLREKCACEMTKSFWVILFARLEVQRTLL